MKNCLGLQAGLAKEHQFASVNPRRNLAISEIGSVEDASAGGGEPAQVVQGRSHFRAVASERKNVERRDDSHGLCHGIDHAFRKGLGPRRVGKFVDSGAQCALDLAGALRVRCNRKFVARRRLADRR